MSTPDVETIKLQLAMAFGQGAGVMLATSDALNHLLSDHSLLIEQAAPSWSVSHWAFTQLTRHLGQLSAHHAAAHNSAVIRVQDLDACIHVVLDLCPCMPKGLRKPMF
jgi:hypothetical protein